MRSRVAFNADRQTQGDIGIRRNVLQAICGLYGLAVALSQSGKAGRAELAAERADPFRAIKQSSPSIVTIYLAMAVPLAA